MTRVQYLAKLFCEYVSQINELCERADGGRIEFEDADMFVYRAIDYQESELFAGVQRGEALIAVPGVNALVRQDLDELPIVQLAELADMAEKY